jgi:hypothetical protein
MNRYATITLATVAMLLGACGSEDEASCGDVTCPAGQYCADIALSVCEAGCQSDQNCAEGQTCQDIDDFWHVGTCRSPNDPPPDQLARCQEACTVLVQCGLITGMEGASCQADCQAADDNTRRAIADCALPWNCESPLPGCMTAECGGSYTCPGGGTCVDHQCL